MGLPSDDFVVIQKGKQPGEPCVITINCPDKTGLGCDICRIILEFGLYITKGGLLYTTKINVHFLAQNWNVFSFFFLPIFYVIFWRLNKENN
jgi:hypothetical protein